VCGLASAALTAVVTAAGGCGEPGYSHVSQYISELGADGAAHGALVSWAGFAPIGALVFGFLALALGGLPRGATAVAGVLALSLFGAAYFFAAFFPCDAGCPATGSLAQSVHNALGFFGYAGATAGLVLLAAAFRRPARWRALFPFTAACAAVVAAAFAAMLSPELAGVRGLSQRVAEIAVFAWIAAVSASLLRAQKEA
jgi:hypothetical protein